MDLPDLCGTQYMDHVLGYEFSNLSDTREPFDKNGINRRRVPDTIKITDRNFVNHFLPFSGIFHTGLQQKNVPDEQLPLVCHTPGMWQKEYRYDLFYSNGCDRSLTLPGFRFLDEFALAT